MFFPFTYYLSLYLLFLFVLLFIYNILSLPYEFLALVHM